LETKQKKKISCTSAEVSATDGGVRMEEKKNEFDLP